MYKFLFFFLITLVPAVTQAQIVNTDLIDSQSDLDYLLESGQIDAEQYRILDEFFSIYFSLDRSELNMLSNEIEDQISADSLSNMPVDIQPEKNKSKLFKTAVIYKIYHKLSDDFSYRRLFSIRGKVTGNLQYFLISEKKTHEGHYYFRERWIKFAQNKYKLKLGNYFPQWGLGVTAGYHSDFLDKTDSPQYQSILYPYLSRYNGLRFEYCGILKPVVMLSYDRSHDLRGRLLAVGLNYSTPAMEIGVLSNYHALDNLLNGNKFSRMLLGSYLHWNKNDYEIETEISESEFKNWAGIISLTKRLEWGRFLLQGWNYPKGFTNPYGGGKANSDYRTIDLEETEISFHSRQNGEYGFLSQTDYKFSSASTFSVVANYWRDAGLENKFRIRFADNIRLAKGWHSRLTFLYGDDNISADYGLRQHYRIDLTHSNRQTGNLRLSAEFKRVFYSYGRRDYLRTEIKYSRRFSEQLASAVKISRLDSDLLDGQPGYWFVYLEENIKFGNSVQIRVVLDSREGKHYNLLSSARVNLQLTMVAD